VSLLHALRLYRESRDLKLLGGDGARAKLLEAEQLALGIDPALVALIRYRLGHVYLRRTTSAESLYDAEGAFRQAARAPSLAPWAFTYRLVCLSRLKQLGEPVDVDAAWRDAARHVRRGPIGEALDEPVPIQSAAFNLLELATYALGFSHDALLAEAGTAEAGEGGAIVLGPGLRDRRDVLPFAVAEQVVASIATTAVAFTLPARPAMARARAPGGEWIELGPSSARLLGLILLGEARTLRPLRTRLAGDRSVEHRDDIYRATLARTRTRLSALAGMPRDEVLVGGPGRMPRLAEGLVIYGAVDLARLDEAED